jgi:hypothetical protein
MEPLEAQDSLAFNSLKSPKRKWGTGRKMALLKPKIAARTKKNFENDISDSEDEALLEMKKQVKHFTFYNELIKKSLFQGDLGLAENSSSNAMNVKRNSSSKGKTRSSKGSKEKKQMVKSIRQPRASKTKPAS